MSGKKTPSDQLLIGAHTSGAGGLYNALTAGRSISATTIQLFTSNQRQWVSKGLDQEAIKTWLHTLKETGLKQIMSHASYLINLGAPDAENLIKSRRTFAEEIKRCIDLDVAFLNFHPGAALKDDPQQCLDRIVESLLECESLLAKSHLRLLLEMTAGQGSSVGHRFEQVAYVLERVEKRLPVGVCIDTCHIFVAGYDLRTPEACDATIGEFDRVVGLEKLYAFHLNDSLKDFGSKVDRHQPLGKGKIGMACFEWLMTDPRTREIPKYLETPGGLELWEKEIALLREFAKAGE